MNRIKRIPGEEDSEQKVSGAAGSSSPGRAEQMVCIGAFHGQRMIDPVFGGEIGNAHHSSILQRRTVPVITGIQAAVLAANVGS